MRPLSYIKTIRDWKGRGGPLGYRLQFQDKQKLYLEFSESNFGRAGEPAADTPGVVNIRAGDSQRTDLC